MKLKRDLIAILVFCFGYRLFYFVFLHPGLILYNSDSVSYFVDVNIFSGLIDMYRTPVYPYVLKCFEYLSGQHFIRNLLLFQQVVSFLSIIPFYYISRYVFKNRFLVVATTLFYACWTRLLQHNVNINPECLCIAGSTLALFLFVKYLEGPKTHKAFFIGFFPLILIMLKPVYVVALLVVLLFLLFRFVLAREERKILYWGLLGWLTAVAGVWGYCEMNRKYNGDFTLSKIELNNSIANIVISGAYKYGGDKVLIKAIDTTKQKGFYTSVYFLNNEYADNYTQHSKDFPAELLPTDDMKFYAGIPNIVNYSHERTSLFVQHSRHTMVYFKYIMTRTEDIFLSYISLLLVVFLEMVFFSYTFIKQRQLAWGESLCILFVLGQFVTIILGGIDDIDRLLIPAYPFIIILIGAFLGILISFGQKRLLERGSRS